MNKRRRKKAYYKLLDGDRITNQERLGAGRYCTHFTCGIEWAGTFPSDKDLHKWTAIQLFGPEIIL